MKLAACLIFGASFVQVHSDDRGCSAKGCNSAIARSVEEDSMDGIMMLQSHAAADPKSTNVFQGGGEWIGDDDNPDRAGMAVPTGLKSCLENATLGLKVYAEESVFGIMNERLPQEFKEQVILHNKRISEQSRYAAIVLAYTADDVRHAVTCAAMFQLPVKAQCGRHAYESYCENGCVLINIKKLDTYEVDKEARTAVLGAGMNLGQVYTYLGDYGLTVPGGTCPTVGLAGLTLGGGKGVLIRLHGMLCDKLYGLDVVLYNGTIIHASAEHHADLFWLARGGGGDQFPGVAVAFYFNLVEAPGVVQYYKELPYHDVGGGIISFGHAAVKYYVNDLVNHPDTRVYARLELHPYGNNGDTIRPSAYVSLKIKFINMTVEDAKTEITKFYNSIPSYNQTVSDDELKVMSWIEQVYDEGGTSSPYSACANMGLTERQKALKQDAPFCGWDSKFDVNMKYRALVMSGIPGDGIDTLLGSSAFAPDFLSGHSNQFYLQIDPSNAAVMKLAPNATAYPWRTQPEMVMQVISKWDESVSGNDIAPVLFYNFGLVAMLQPYVGTRSYHNYLDRNMPGGAVPAESYWGDNAERIRQIKERYAVPMNDDFADVDWELSAARPGMKHKMST